jgi:UDP-2-acetamido-2,6-beta-L-arabino-hexul-4-ose reductase
MNILVTGADGFIGKNLVAHLKQDERAFTLLTFTNEHSYADLEEKVKKSDVIVHLAGINRAQTDEDFFKGNVKLSEILGKAIQASDRVPKVLFTSTIHAVGDSVYGQSKASAEQLFLDLAKKTDIKLAIFRLPHVFGKWSKPNYNSVVATFCHNIANDKPVVINDASVILDLLYIDDLIEYFCEFMFSDKVVWPASGIIEEFLTYSISVGNLCDIITQFHEDRTKLQVKAVALGLERALYATYLSYLLPKQFEYEVAKYSDARGDFVEVLKTENSGQFSYFTAEIGVVRGRHYHHTKSEKFLVVQGAACFRFQNITHGERHEITATAAGSKIVETIPGWAHEIENIGAERLIVLVWANEVFDPEKPDTFSFQLTHH